MTFIIIVKDSEKILDKILIMIVKITTEKYIEYRISRDTIAKKKKKDNAKSSPVII
ncbi:MAG: hypothetical protein ACFFBE_11555 [Promethearchaeota archaeon]